MRKSGLGNDPLSWIKSTLDDSTRTEAPAREDAPRPPEQPAGRVAAAPETPAKKGTVPKFKTFEVRLTVLFRDDHLDFLDRMVRDVNKNRTSQFRGERITKNTVLRAMVDAFRETQADLRNVPDEEALAQRLRARIR